MKTLTIGVFEESGYLGESVDRNAVEFVARLKACLDSIPEQHRKSAVIVLRSWGEDNPGVIEMSYERPETAEERAQFQAEEACYLRESEERERAQLKALLAKYPS